MCMGRRIFSHSEQVTQTAEVVCKFAVQARHVVTVVLTYITSQVLTGKWRSVNKNVHGGK